MTQDEALKLALEALEKLEKHNRGVKITTIKTGVVAYPAQIAQEAITSLRQAIAEAEKQEPFGYFRYDLRLDAWVQNRAGLTGTPFYTSPPQRSEPSGKPSAWVGLTDEEIDQGLLRSNHALQTAVAWRDGVEWAIKQLKEKNT